MADLVHRLFGWVCGQNPAHAWCPGGLLLPTCQRCTGLYAGVAAAALLHCLLRPRLTGKFLETHGGFLLLMVPLGFHWVPSDATLRAVSGSLFGAALFTFLYLPLRDSKPPGPQPGAGSAKMAGRGILYFSGLLLATAAVILAGIAGGSLAWSILRLLTIAGAAVLFGIAIVSVASLVYSAFSRARGCFLMRRDA